MALIDNLKRGVSVARPPTPAAITADVTAKLEAAETALAELEAKRDAASLDALTDAPGGRDALAKLNAASTEARAQIETLRAAHRAAIQREQEANRKLRRDAIQHAFRRTKDHLKARDEAAAEFGAAIQRAALAYEKIHTADQAARLAYQIGNIGEYPIEAFGDDAIERVASGEMWRHTPTKKGEVLAGYALPAAAYPDLQFQHWPEGVPPIADQFAANSQAIIAKIAPKVPE